jgi:glycosyltransferase involved in cell wall biosynthesis
MSAGRIVVVIAGVPHPLGDVTGRWSFSLLKGLALRGFDVRCLAVSTQPEWVPDAQAYLQRLGVSASFYSPRTNGSHRKLATLREPFSHLLGDDLRRALDAEERLGYDVLQLEQLWTGYLAAGRDRTLTSVHYLQLLDLENEWRLSGRFLFSKYLMCRSERRLLGKLAHVRTLTPRLEHAVRSVNPDIDAHTVPISVDPDFFEFVSDDRQHEPVLGFVGTMTWNPGYLAAVRLITRIFPKVRAKRSDARLLLVGWDARSALREYLDVPGVEIVENVRDSKPYFERLQVLAYPLPKGSGMMVKILEGFAYGIPVVTTSEGIEGIDAADGVHALLADDDDALAARILDVLSDRTLRERLRRNGRRLVEERYSPAATAASLERVYERI